jgi:radial spoke head protein 4A
MATDIQTTAKFKEFGDLKQQLSTKCAQDNSNKNLWDHLTRVMDHIVFHCPSEALNKLEEISYLLKHEDTHKLEEFLKTNEEKLYAKPSNEETKQASQPYIDGSQKFFKKAEGGEDGEEGGAAAVGNVPDLLCDSKIWQWAGVSFGEYDTMLLQKSLKALIVKAGATSMRFWGKIKGTEKDYWVVEAVQEGGATEAVEGEEPFEARGTGVNQFAYWVTNSPIDEWTQLNDIKPGQIRQARNIKVLLSGNLNQRIFTNPFYFEEEAIYLRA